MTLLSESFLDSLLSPNAETRRAAEAQWAQGTRAARIAASVAFLQRSHSSVKEHHQHLVAVLLRRAILQWRPLSEDHTGGSIEEDRRCLEALVHALLRLWASDANHASSIIQNALAFCLAECAAADASLVPRIVQASLLPQVSPHRLLTLWTALVERARPMALSDVDRLYQHCMSHSNSHADTDWIPAFLEFLVAYATAAAIVEHTSLSSLGEHYLRPWLPKLCTFPNADAWAATLCTAAEQVPELLQSCAGDVLLLAQRVLRQDTQHNPEAQLPVAALVAAVLRSNGTTATPAAAALSAAMQTCWQVLVAADDDDPDPLEPASLHDDDALPDDDEHIAYAMEVGSDLLRAWPSAAAAWLLPHLQPPARAALYAWQCLVAAIPAALGAPGAIQALQCALTVLQNTASSSVLQQQYQALRLLGLLCECAVELPPQWYACMLEALLRALHHSETAMIALACRALVSYVRQVPSSLCSDGAPAMLQALVTGPLQSVPSTMDDPAAYVVQIRAVETLGAMASCIDAAVLRPFYPSILPGLGSYAAVLWQSPPPSGEYARRRAAVSLEVATLWGQALPDLFAPDARRLLPGLMAALQDSSDVQLESRLWAASARLATVVPDDVAPYLGVLVPLLLQRVTDPAAVEFAEGDINHFDSKPSVDSNAETGTERLTMAIPGRGLTQVTLHTTKFQEKAQAARAIYEQAMAMPLAFGPYGPACFEAFLPLVSFVYAAEVRATAAQAMAAVWEAACAYGEECDMQDVPKAYLPKILHSIATQLPLENNTLEIETVHALAESLQEICRIVFLYTRDGESLLENVHREDIERVVQNCLATMVLCLERRLNLSKTLMDGPLSGDDERNELTAQLQQEEDLLTPLVDSIGYLLKCLGPHFTPIFEQYVVPVLGAYVTTTEQGSTTKDVRARWSAICLFDDCVEYCGSDAAHRFGPLLLQGILFGMNDSNHQDLELKRASIYGIAQLARHGSPDLLAPHMSYLMPQLCHITTSESKEPLCPDDDDLARAIFENAISALASLVLLEAAPFRNNCEMWIKRDSMVRLFLNSLPLKEDDDEAFICHMGLCDLIEHGSMINVRDPHQFSAVLPCVQKVLEWCMSEEADHCGSHKEQTLMARLQAIHTVLQQSPNYQQQHAAVYNNVTSPCSATEYP